MGILVLETCWVNKPEFLPHLVCLYLTYNLRYTVTRTSNLLRKWFGPVNIDNIWKIRNNIETDKLIEGADIVRYIKAHRIKWLGHIQRMDKSKPTRKQFYCKPMGTTPVGRTRQRWQEYVMEDFKKLKVKKWKETAKDRRTWRDLAEKAKTHRGL
jgi:hypothetical protein